MTHTRDCCDPHDVTLEQRIAHLLHRGYGIDQLHFGGAVATGTAMDPSVYELPPAVEIELHQSRYAIQRARTGSGAVL